MAGKGPARVEGVPVEEVQVQPSRQGGSPMMVVAQRLSSGEVIQTIEGPTADVASCSRAAARGLDSAGRPAEALTVATGCWSSPASFRPIHSARWYGA
jgi:hypothetical protein